MVTHNSVTRMSGICSGASFVDTEYGYAVVERGADADTVKSEIIFLENNAFRGRGLPVKDGPRVKKRTQQCGKRLQAATESA